MKSEIAKRILDNTPEELKIYMQWYADIVKRIHTMLKERNLSQEDLAGLLGEHPPALRQWLKGEQDFSPKTLAKLQAELDVPLLIIPKTKSESKPPKPIPPCDLPYSSSWLAAA